MARLQNGDPPYMRKLVAEFTVPGVPHPKERPRFTRTGRAYTPAATRAAESRVETLFLQGWIEPTWRVECLTSRAFVELEIDAYIPDNKTRDVDNIAKLVQDALNGMAYHDDRQIRRLEVEAVLDRADPRTVVRLYKREEIL